MKIMLLLLTLPGSSLFAQLPHSAYVLNSLGENLSAINLETGAVTADAATLGLFSNQIVLQAEVAFVVNSGLNAIQKIDLNTFATTGNIDVGSSTNPWAATFIDNDRLAVSLLIANSVRLVNPVSGQILQTIPVGVSPEGMVVSGGRLYVANTGFNGSGYNPGTVSSIDLGDFSSSTIPVSINPQALAVDSQGRIIVCATGDFAAINGAIDIIDPVMGVVVQTIALTTGISNVIITSQDKAYFATFGFGVLVYNLVSGSFERDENNPLPGGPGLAADRDGRVYISSFAEDSLRVFNPLHQQEAAYAVGDGPLSVAVYEPESTGIHNPEQLPHSFALAQNFPNPFNPSTTIAYFLEEDAEVLLQVYDARGALVDVPLKQYQAAGRHQLLWNARDFAGNQLTSGVYLYRLTVAGRSISRKMVLVR